MGHEVDALPKKATACMLCYCRDPNHPASSSPKAISQSSYELGVYDKHLLVAGSFRVVRVAPWLGIAAQRRILKPPQHKRCLQSVQISNPSSAFAILMLRALLKTVTH
jgi:hypothetical protein